MSYTGHSVLQTLIRCHFSPEHSTGTHYTFKNKQFSAQYSQFLALGPPTIATAIGTPILAAALCQQTVFNNNFSIQCNPTSFNFM